MMPEFSSRRPRARLAACALVVLAAWTVGQAQEEIDPQEDEPLINFVFAAQLGSGVYASSGRVIQVYRIPIPYTLRSEDEHRWGIRLNFPVALGFYNFRTGDIFEGRLPDDVSTFTVLGGVELTTRIGEHWKVGPKAELGYARDVALAVGSMLYSVGLEGLGTYPLERTTLLVRGRGVWAGQADERLLDDDFLRLQTSIEARHPLPWRARRRTFDVGVFAASHLFFDSVAFFRQPQQISVRTLEEVPESNLSAQWEIGFTVGSEPGKIGKLPVPRLGLSYLFGDDVDIVRFVIGGVF